MNHCQRNVETIHGHSTEHSGVIGSWRFAIATLTDIKAAFNNTWVATIESALKSHAAARKWVNYMLVGQSITVSKGETTVEGTVI